MNFSGPVEWLQSGGIYLSGGSDSLLSLSLGNDRGVTWYREIPAAWHQGLSGSGQAPCSSPGTAAAALAFLLWYSVNYLLHVALSLPSFHGHPAGAGVPRRAACGIGLPGSLPWGWRKPVLL